MDNYLLWASQDDATAIAVMINPWAREGESRWFNRFNRKVKVFSTRETICPDENLCCIFGSVLPSTFYRTPPRLGVCDRNATRSGRPGAQVESGGDIPMLTFRPEYSSAMCL